VEVGEELQEALDSCGEMTMACFSYLLRTEIVD
jgi:hypothetical protein